MSRATNETEPTRAVGNRRWRRAGALGLATALLAVGFGSLTAVDPGPSSVAAADIPVATPGATPPVQLDELDPLPIKQWGVVGSGTSYSSAKPEVWDFAEIGNTIFVGGNFTGVQRDADDPSSNINPQPYLAAFDRDSGAWISTFRPTFDRTVYSLEVAPNGKLLVGGEFTSVNGTARAAIVMLDPVTGAIDANFKANAQGNRAMVREIVRAGNQIYVAGQFSYMHGFAADPWLWNAARLDGNTGKVDLAWIPKFAGGLWDITVDNDRGHVSAAGYFTSVNAQPNTALMASVAITNGAFLPGLSRFEPNQSNQTDTTSVVYANNRLYVGGAQHIVQVLDASTHRRVGYNTVGITCSRFSPRDCGTFYGGGDIQTMEVTSNGIVLAGCHCFGDQYVSTSRPLHYSSFTNSFSHRRYALAYDAADSRPSGSFIPGLKGRVWGTYAIDTDSRGCYYVGGDYNRRSDGKWIGGFGRFCKPVAPATNFAATSAAGNVTLSWSAAPSQLPITAYKVYRNGTFVGDATGTSYGVAGLPAGSTQNFTLVAKDASGRLSPSVATSVVVSAGGGGGVEDTLAPTVPTDVVGTVNGNTVTLNWGASTDLPAGGAGLSGYLIHKDWVYLKFVPAGTTTFTDTGVASGTRRYEVRAVDKKNQISSPAAPVRVTVP